MHGRADLHCHTTASDGSFTPKELVMKAEDMGLSALAVSDHDTVVGLDEAIAEAKSLEIVNAVEISTEYMGSDVHILGYFIDTKSVAMMDFLAEQRNNRLIRAYKMVEKLNDLGVPLDMDLVLRNSGDAIGRPHIARAMMQAKLASSWDEIFTKYIGKQSPAYVEYGHLDPKEAIEIIIKAKGVPVLAHPGISQVDYLIDELVGYGLEGIECTYPLHSPSKELHYRMIAQQKGLIATGGSDCHGPDSKSGVILGKATVGMDVVDMLRNKSKEKQ